ncbi:BrnA antitoxin family protein [Paracidobacterium acidisoli]|uniref:BrnA antitoxin family protein n=1 Tax=Paracidobacterium acidisoli TaxID=2303751 RepID=A0A372IJ92_9BACT|nr:BrnA antitoxin family protein [Paracidobacterium acidisoli]MBT9333178.1 BrnA antitoxin family protein [Paracidobacterium acidisoli]
MRRPKIKSQTDWERVKRESGADAPIAWEPEDGPYDPNDEAAVEAYWKAATIVRRPGQRGPQKAPTKERITIRLSHDIVEHFRSTGGGWQTRMDEALREWMKGRRKKAAK